MKKRSIAEVRVIFGDTDAWEVVYYSNYFRWFEIGRSEFIRSQGLSFSRLMEEEDIALPVVEAYCHYLKSARYDDLLLIETSIAYVKRVSIRFDYEIYKKEGYILLAKGFTVHAFSNKNGKVVRIPKSLSELVSGK